MWIRSIGFTWIHLNASNEFSMSNANEIEIYCLHCIAIRSRTAKYFAYSYYIAIILLSKNNARHAFFDRAISFLCQTEIRSENIRFAFVMRCALKYWLICDAIFYCNQSTEHEAEHTLLFAPISPLIRLLMLAPFYAAATGLSGANHWIYMVAFKATQLYFYVYEQISMKVNIWSHFIGRLWNK